MIEAEFFETSAWREAARNLTTAKQISSRVRAVAQPKTLGTQEAPRAKFFCSVADATTQIFPPSLGVPSEQLIGQPEPSGVGEMVGADLGAET